MNKEECVICNEEKHKGIHLLNKFICLDCQSKMVHTEVEDPEYHIFIQKLKEVKIPSTI